MHSLFLRVALEFAGTLIVLFTLREVFRDIFHPTSSGTLSDLVGRVLSRLLRKTRFRQAVGALALVSVIFCWVLLLAVGFATVYYGEYPAHFTGSAVSHSSGYLERVLPCLYFSIGTLDTFQTFNLVPATNWLRLVVSVEGLIGISMITASVSWLVLLYPALERQRGTARFLSLVAQAEERTGLSAIRELDAMLLMNMSDRVLQSRLDMVLFPILLHFYALSREFSLTHALPVALDFARRGTRVGEPPDVRLAATQLLIALESMAEIIAERVTHNAKPYTPEEVFRSFAARER